MASVGSEGPAAELPALPEPQAQQEEEQEEEEQEGVVLAAAAPLDGEEDAPVVTPLSSVWAQAGAVLLGLCGLAALLAGAVVVSRVAAARADGEAAGSGGFAWLSAAFPEAVSRIWRRAEYETVAEEGMVGQDPSGVAGIRV